jgi:predicted Zn finger-like uncharacterized protein
MHTRCPYCEAVFRVSVAQITAADGRVRCGQCQGVFDAMHNMQETEPEEPPPPPPAKFTHVSPTLQRIQEKDQDRPRTTSNPLAGLRSPGGNKSLAAQLVLALLLILALPVQYAWFHRLQWAQSPDTRPWAESLCALAGCELPPLRDLDKIELISRDVRAHPRVKGALLITATLINRADFEQPYPTIRIGLSDLQGRTIAARDFTPDTYLRGQNNGDRAMPSQIPVQVKLETLDPGPAAEAFEFDFL